MNGCVSSWARLDEPALGSLYAGAFSSLHSRRNSADANADLVGVHDGDRHVCATFLLAVGFSNRYGPRLWLGGRSACTLRIFPDQLDDIASLSLSACIVVGAGNGSATRRRCRSRPSGFPTGVGDCRIMVEAMAPSGSSSDCSPPISSRRSGGADASDSGGASSSWNGRVWLVTNPPPGYRPGRWTPPTAVAARRDFSTADMLRTPQFYSCVGGVLYGTTAGQMTSQPARDLHAALAARVRRAGGWRLR